MQDFTEYRHPDLQNQDIEYAISCVEKDSSQANIWKLLDLFSQHMNNEGTLLLPKISATLDEMMEIPKFSLDEPGMLPDRLRKVELAKGGLAYCAFTSWKELNKGEKTDWQLVPMQSILEKAYQDDSVMGLLINPWDVSVLLDKPLLELILNADGEGGQTQEPQTSSSSIYLEKGNMEHLDTDVLFRAPQASMNDLVQEIETDSDQEAPEDNDRHKLTTLMFLALPDVINPGEQEKTLVQAITMALDQMVENEMTSAAIDVESILDLCFSREDAVPVIVIAIASWINRNPALKLEITIVCQKQEDYDLFYSYLFDE